MDFEMYNRYLWYWGSLEASMYLSIMVIGTNDSHLSILLFRIWGNGIWAWQWVSTCGGLSENGHISTYIWMLGSQMVDSWGMALLEEVCHWSNRTATKTEVGTVIGLTMLFVGGLWKALGLWTRKAAECFKQSLVSHPSRKVEDSSAGSNGNLRAR